LGGKIPEPMRLKVINDWLLGMSRDDIAFVNSISKGTVSNIIKEFKRREIMDYDLVRLTAINLRGKGLTLADLSSSLNLRNMLDMLELPEERVEKFLMALSIHNYKNDIEEPEKFINQVEKTSEYVHRLDVSVFDIIEEFENKEKELQKLESEIYSAKLDLEKTISKNKKLILQFEKFKNSIAI